jgi:hypothetical protein
VAAGLVQQTVQLVARSSHDLTLFVVFLWRFMGTPGAWVLIMAVLLIIELFTGPIRESSFWMATLLFAYFASRIAAALEKMADRK